MQEICSYWFKNKTQENKNNKKQNKRNKQYTRYGYLISASSVSVVGPLWNSSSL